MVKEAWYDEVADTVTFDCKLPNGEPYYLHWPRPDFGPAMGIKRDIIPEGGIPVEILGEELPKFAGKPFTLVIEKVPVPPEGKADAT